MSEKIPALAALLGALLLALCFLGNYHLALEPGEPGPWVSLGLGLGYLLSAALAAFALGAGSWRMLKARKVGFLSGLAVAVSFLALASLGLMLWLALRTQ